MIIFSFHCAAAKRAFKRDMKLCPSEIHSETMASIAFPEDIDPRTIETGLNSPHLFQAKVLETGEILHTIGRSQS